MRRLSRRISKPYKSPRLVTMCALLVCLFLMMNSLRSFRGPGDNAQRILSNLDSSLQQVNDSSSQDVGEPASQNQQPDQPEQTSPPDVPPDGSLDGQVAGNAVAEKAAELSDQSNVGDEPKLNLREDLFLQDQLGLVQDGGVKLQKLEMPSYWRILSVVKGASFKSLLQKADAKVRFNELYSSASKNRARLVTLNINVRRITRYVPEFNPADVEELFEVWGWSETSKAWLYVFVTPELPPGLNADSPVNQNVKFAGYFYKLQGYQPGAAKPGSKPQLAPLLIGKFEIVDAPKRAVLNRFAPLEWIVGAIILVVGVIAIAARLIFFRTKPPTVIRPRLPANFGSFPDGFIESGEPDSSDRR